MIRWEIRKTVNITIVLISGLLCVAWFFVCRNVFIGNYEDINGEIYRSYIEALSDLTYEEQQEYIESESGEINIVLSSPEEMREKYLRGEISDEEYLCFNERYEICNAKSATFSVIERKFRRITSNPKLRLIYDLELEGHLTTMTADFPLIIMLLVIGCGIFISDIPTEPFIKTCKNGRAKTFFAKLSAYFIICAVLITAFNLSELAAFFSKNLGDLSAPAASMEAFGSVDTSVSCLSLIVKTFLFRILGEITVCMVFFSLSVFCKNYIAFFCSAAALLIIPSLFINIVPHIFKGLIIYYTLSGSLILIEENGLSALLGAAFWIAVSLITVKKSEYI